MVELAGGSDEVYADNAYLKKQLSKRYGHMIFFTQAEGKSDMVCFKNSASAIISDMRKAEASARRKGPVDCLVESQTIHNKEMDQK